MKQLFTIFVIGLYLIGFSLTPAQADEKKYDDQALMYDEADYQGEDQYYESDENSYEMMGEEFDPEYDSEEEENKLNMDHY